MATEESRMETDEIAAVNAARRTPHDPYEFMTILQIHAFLLQRKGGGEFRLTNGKKHMKPSAKRTQFETWRERTVRRIIYIPKNGNVVLLSDLLTKDNEIVKLLDFLDRANAYETFLKRPHWQRFARLTERPGEAPPAKEDVVDLYCRKCLRSNHTPSAQEVAAATGIPASTLKDTEAWKAYRKLFGLCAKNANLSPEYLAHE
jgi:hypothetical protein